MEEECCKWVDKSKWDKKTHEWKDKPFVVEHYRSIFYMPIGFGKAVKKIIAEIEGKDLAPEVPIMLCRNEGMWGGNLYYEVKKADPELPIEKLNGKFFSMYFEAKAYKEVGKFYEEIKDYCEEQGWKPKEFMSYYCTCPNCTKKKGKMQIILLARL